MTAAHAAGGAHGSAAAVLLVLPVVAYFLWVHLAAHTRGPGTLATGVAAAGAGTAALLHWAIVPEYLATWWPGGLFFLGCGAVQFLSAERLVRAPSRAVLLAAGLVAGGMIALWLWSRTAGVPGVPGQPEPIGLSDTVCAIAELVTVALCAYLLRRRVPPVPAYRTSALPQIATGPQNTD